MPETERQTTVLATTSAPSPRPAICVIYYCSSLPLLAVVIVSQQVYPSPPSNQPHFVSNNRQPNSVSLYIRSILITDLFVVYYQYLCRTQIICTHHFAKIISLTTTYFSCLIFSMHTFKTLPLFSNKVLKPTFNLKVVLLFIAFSS